MNIKFGKKNVWCCKLNCRDCPSSFYFLLIKKIDNFKLKNGDFEESGINNVKAAGVGGQFNLPTPKAFALFNRLMKARTS